MNATMTETTDADTVGDQIRRRRQALGLTLKELAEELGMTLNSVYRWEKMIVPPPPSRVQHLMMVLDRLEAKKRKRPAAATAPSS